MTSDSAARAACSACAPSASRAHPVIVVTGARGTPRVVPAPVLVDVQGAADYLGVSEDFVLRLIAKGELPKIKLGRCRRISLADLDNYIARQR